ncbi:MAG: hypothetical protein ACYDBP_07240 [Leptospirales bacterium]
MRKFVLKLVVSTILYLIVPIPALAASDPATDNSLFSAYQTSDWIGLGLTSVADFADLDSSYSTIESQLHTYNKTPVYGTPQLCPAGSGLKNCFAGHRNLPFGEGNPLITGLFSTRYPTALDYAAFGALELGVQAVVAWALPERWRSGAWGIFIGIGAADTICNAYGGGVTFRF